jgi:hypothetical protein
VFYYTAKLEITDPVAGLVCVPLLRRSVVIRTSSFLSSSCPSGRLRYVLCVSRHFILLHFQSDFIWFQRSGTLRYFTYTTVMALAFWFTTGTIGFIATMWFVWKIYGSVKID